MSRVVRADWSKDNSTIRHIRYVVFVEEQKVPLVLDFDGRDPTCTHVLAYNDKGSAVGTGRIQRDGKIGRMAVLREFRKAGYGKAMLMELMGIAESQGHTEVFLDAQEVAFGFYDRLGFVAEGDSFIDAGIPHRRMRRKLHG
jgi:predicted GNAT family N-acyltransferase